ncbi:Thioredoxin-like fold,Peroxiredoxin, AhpC-type,Alkyl hydroperoxide reductase subunit C/ Thiol [Cinara cedri]|uniref:thioredoxin-dependent peroxiredoxin n=1 Tax=Cinara cedri TaxID=506608 RepID=A0A5E4MPN8_9HEMI|nr:Thioredoxin-like fold,Peroxiredoxin, AhpC-type,Alkyl hydroperoxide reductase subunit C/ Thiol [Cinara cedri]
MLRIGQKVSDVRLETTAGNFGVHEYFRGSWGLIVCYVTNFSAVCADELSQLVYKFHEFKSRNVKILAMSCDSVESHIKWIEDVKKISGIKSVKEQLFPFPIVSDRNRMLSLYLNTLDANCTDEDGIPLPCRATFILAPDLTIQLIHFYPQTIGRNFDEIFRSIDALQLSYKFSNTVFTPSGWKPITDCMASPKISRHDIEKQFPSSMIIELPSGKEYMCIVPKEEIKSTQKTHEK